MKTTLRMIVAVVLMLIITLSAILIIDKAGTRAKLDLTENNIYSLSEGTHEIVSQINTPLTMKLYYSRTAALEGPEQIREYNNYFHYVRNMVESYARVSDGKIDVEVVDPRAFSDAEQEAMDAGLSRIPLSGDESFFFGLVAETELGKQETIPFFRMERRRFVEYDLTKMISEVTSSKQKKVGILSSLSVMGSSMSPRMARMMGQQAQQQPWVIVNELRKRYKVEKVQKDTASIDKDLDLLMVIHPKKLSNKTLYAIDQYVMRGGKLAVFVDPFCLQDKSANPRSMMQRRQGQQGPPSSDLNQLLEKWGVKMQKNAVAADRSLAVTAQVSRDSRPKPVVTYLELGDDCTADGEVVTAQLDSLTMLFAGALQETGSKNTEITPLLQTTDTGDTWEPSRPSMISMEAMDLDKISQSIGDDPRKLALGYRISGSLKTNFPDGPPDIKSKEEEEGGNNNSEAPDPGNGENGDDEQAEDKPDLPELVKESKPGAQVVVYSDVDMLSDRLAYQQSFLGTSSVGDNASLALNTVDFLAGSRSLIAIRSKGRQKRPFEVIKNIEAETEQAVASRVKSLNQKIQEYQQKLQGLVSESGEQQELIGSEIVKRRRQIQDEIRKAKKKLRELNAGKRRKIEALKAGVQFHTMVWAPGIVLLIAIGLSIARSIKARKYATRRSSR